MWKNDKDKSVKKKKKKKKKKSDHKNILVEVVEMIKKR